VAHLFYRSLPEKLSNPNYPIPQLGYHILHFVLNSWITVSIKFHLEFKNRIRIWTPIQETLLTFTDTTASSRVLLAGTIHEVNNFKATIVFMANTSINTIISTKHHLPPSVASEIIYATTQVRCLYALHFHSNSQSLNCNTSWGISFPHFHCHNLDTRTENLQIHPCHNLGMSTENLSITSTCRGRLA